jgi:hypothetical protein
VSSLSSGLIVQQSIMKESYKKTIGNKNLFFTFSPIKKATQHKS